MRSDRITSVFLFAFALFVCFKSYHLNMGQIHNPGPGLIPFLSGVLLGCLSLSIFIKSVINKEQTKAFGGGWMRGGWVIGSLILYALVLEKIGFLITTFAFLLILLLSFQPRKVVGAFVVSFVTVLISYLLFSVWLKVQLPKGIIGI